MMPGLLCIGWPPAEAQTSTACAGRGTRQTCVSYAKALKPTEEPRIDPQKRYELVVVLEAFD